jgi:hypothetical protein
MSRLYSVLHVFYPTLLVVHALYNIHVYCTRIFHSVAQFHPLVFDVIGGIEVEVRAGEERHCAFGGAVVVLNEDVGTVAETGRYEIHHRTHTTHAFSLIGRC